MKFNNWVLPWAKSKEKTKPNFETKEEDTKVFARTSVFVLPGQPGSGGGGRARLWTGVSACTDERADWTPSPKPYPLKRRESLAGTCCFTIPSQKRQLFCLRIWEVPTVLFIITAVSAVPYLSRRGDPAGRDRLESDRAWTKGRSGASRSRIPLSAEGK